MVREAIAAVNLKPGDETGAVEEMRAGGAEVVSPEDAMARLGGSAS